jgi:uncharacterized membrane protein YcjF (UPF0283 family)
MQDVHTGVRQFTLTVKIEALTQTDARFAYNALETIREKLKFRKVKAALLGVECSIADIGQTVDLTAALDDRNRSIAALDVRLNAAIKIVDPDRYPYIGSWDVNGTLQN